MHEDVPATVLELWLNKLTEETWCGKRTWNKTVTEELVSTVITHPHIPNYYYFLLNRKLSESVTTSIALQIFLQTDTNSVLMYEKQFARQMLTGLAQENILFEKALGLYELVTNWLTQRPSPLLQTIHFLIANR